MSLTSSQFTVPDLSNRIAIVTGANAGLGFEICKALSARNATVIMACRSPDKGEIARQAILKEHSSGILRVEKLDVSSLASVRRFAQGLNDEFTHIDLLINNAGIMAVPEMQSVDGFEMQFATNHLGHFLLTGLLLPKLCDTQNSRIVSVSSLAAKQGIIDIEDPMGKKQYDPWKAYNQSKLANLIFALELQRRLGLSSCKTSSIAAHPGGSTTNLFSTPGGSLVKKVFMPITKHFLFQSAEDGAQPILFAATAAEAQPGGYYGPSRMGEMKGPLAEAKIPEQARDEDTARRLWVLSEQLTGFNYLPDREGS